MGYTHYYRLATDFTDEQWSQTVHDVNRVYKALPTISRSSGGYHTDQPLIIRGGFGVGKPEINEDMIFFNGDQATGMDHETCNVTRHATKFDFCKTARKPYDLLVQATYLVCAYHNPAFRISSDGDREEWQEAIRLTESVLSIDLSEVAAQLDTQW